MRYRKINNVTVTRGLTGYYVDDEQFRYLGVVRRNPDGKGWVTGVTDRQAAGPFKTREAAAESLRTRSTP